MQRTAGEALEKKLALKAASGIMIGRRFQLEGEPLSEEKEACGANPELGSGRNCACGVSTRAHRRKKGISKDLYKAVKAKK